jgi:predicted Zn-dependent protease
MKKIILLLSPGLLIFLMIGHLLPALGQEVMDERLEHLTSSQIKLHILSLEGLPVYRDKKLDAYIDRVGQRVLASSDHAGQKYVFLIRDNPLPGAHVIGIPVVYIDRGLFAALNSEAELATIIGHEIGHNVANHPLKRRQQRIGTGVLSTLASILAGNSAIGNSIQRQANVTQTIRGREQELESDRFGIEYSYKAGYDPTEIINGLSQVFDFSKLAVGIGAGTVTHHGLRESHPREDIRLRAALDDSSKLSPGEGYIGRNAYRNAVEGALFGQNYAAQTPKGLGRFTNKTLGITFLYPESWSLNVKGSDDCFCPHS